MWLATLNEFEFESGLLLELLQQRVRRRAKDVMNFVNLIELVVAREQRAQSKHLEEDAADSPVVHLVVVVAVSQQALRRPVPPGRDVLCERRLRVDSAAGPEVG